MEHDKRHDGQKDQEKSWRDGGHNDQENGPRDDRKKGQQNDSRHDEENGQENPIQSGGENERVGRGDKELRVEREGQNVKSLRRSLSDQAGDVCKSKKVNVGLHALWASVVAVFISLFGYTLNHEALGIGMFLLVPFFTGLSISFMSRGRMKVVICAFTALIISLLLLFTTGFEGLACILMAMPILFFAIGIGAIVGYLFGFVRKGKPHDFTIILLSLSAMSLVGWVNDKPAEPRALVVKTSMKFYAPMDRVWRSVREPEKIEGDPWLLEVLGLPLPYRCEMAKDGKRVCYFREGEMIQRITEDEYGKRLSVKIEKCTFEVRQWISFNHARYDFIERAGYVEVVRHDNISSTLRPRWYWEWFEEKCVQAEHAYVMNSMKMKAEGGN